MLHWLQQKLEETGTYVIGGTVPGFLVRVTKLSCSDLTALNGRIISE
jgi:hypothetical protein